VLLLQRRDQLGVVTLLSPSVRPEQGHKKALSQPKGDHRVH
jgi:hypothetical protein